MAWLGPPRSDAQLTQATADQVLADLAGPSPTSHVDEPRAHLDLIGFCNGLMIFFIWHSAHDNVYIEAQGAGFSK